MSKAKRKRSIELPNFEAADSDKGAANGTDIDCPSEDLLKLAERVQENIPENDHLAYLTRLERINWENVAFGEYSAEKCKQLWIHLHRRVRKFRLMKEVVSEVKEYIEKSEKHLARQKYPDMPKQPLNSYLLFALENRAVIAEQFTNWNSKDIARKLGNLFKQLHPDQRQIYEKRAAIARNDYLEKLQAFHEAHPEFLASKKTKLEPPKKPRSPFEIYFQSEGDKEEIDAREKCREQWNEMADEDKLFWINWAEEEHDKYIEDLKKFIKDHPKYVPPTVQGLSQKNQAIKDRLAGKPVKPPKTSFQLFTKLMSQREGSKNHYEADGVAKSIGGAEAMVLFSKQWKNCSEEEKNKYKERLSQLWEQYAEDVAAYVETLPPHERDQFLEISQTKKKSKKVIKTIPIVNKAFTLKQPEKPPLSVISYFANIYQGKGDPRDAWNLLSAEKKFIYENAFAHKKRHYLKQYDDYLRSLTREELEELAKSTADASDDMEESDLDC